MIKKCKNCDKEIPQARLEIIPDTEYCVPCADLAPQKSHNPDALCLKSSAMTEREPND